MLAVKTNVTWSLRACPITQGAPLESVKQKNFIAYTDLIQFVTIRTHPCYRKSPLSADACGDIKEECYIHYFPSYDDFTTYVFTSFCKASIFEFLAARSKPFKIILNEFLRVENMGLDILKRM